MKLKDAELFIECCKDNNLEKVQACLTLEVDVNAVDAHGLTAAYWAASYGHIEVIGKLAATGLVDWNMADCIGYTPLHEALFCGHSDVSRVIIQSQDKVWGDYGHGCRRWRESSLC